MGLDVILLFRICPNSIFNYNRQYMAPTYIPEDGRNAGPSAAYSTDRAALARFSLDPDSGPAATGAMLRLSYCSHKTIDMAAIISRERMYVSNHQSCTTSYLRQLLDWSRDQQCWGIPCSNQGNIASERSAYPAENPKISPLCSCWACMLQCTHQSRSSPSNSSLPR